ncbi:MAG: type II toxin-antitoxin system prevent-host-death family antitoxin [Candidatus Eremiobacteraeota bacterium]|nr:type II toxin-antitoxin system prevent-host-death family antitoxin [Candidatus Eremiobacteraeota bacterium]
MISVTFSELRNNAKKYIDAVEKGEIIEVYRRGKPVAMLTPISRRSSVWWKKSSPLNLSGIALSGIIIAQREERP